MDIAILSPISSTAMSVSKSAFASSSIFLKALIESNGGKNVGSISSKTTYVLAGDKMGPSKLQKANDLGIRILSEAEFIEMLNA